MSTLKTPKEASMDKYGRAERIGQGLKELRAELQEEYETLTSYGFGQQFWRKARSTVFAKHLAGTSGEDRRYLLDTAVHGIGRYTNLISTPEQHIAYVRQLEEELARYHEV